jgi:cell wall-associated NlpC family hydrolase
MKYFKLLLIIPLIQYSTVFSQEKLIKHTVKKGETISAISKMYKVDPTAIYELNPDCSRVLKLESIILIPRQSLKGNTSKTISKLDLQQKIHEVQPKETLFGIAKQYEISLDELNNANPELAQSNLKVGQKINIPTKAILINGTMAKKEVSKLEPKKEIILTKQPIDISPPKDIISKSVIHEVVASETKFGIAKFYGITVAELDKLNPILEKEALKIGQKIIVPFQETKNKIDLKDNLVNETLKMDSKLQVTKVVDVEKVKPIQESSRSQIHEVQPKETKYGIAKQYGISIAELESQNPSIVKNLFVGAKLIISVDKEFQGNSTVTTEIVESSVSENKQEIETIAGSLAKWNTSEELADELIRMASDNLGSRYRPGGTSKNGFDCSGLMYATFSSLDIKLPRSSHEMALIGSKIDINEAKKGDLIFFKTRGASQINHVGMVVEVNDGEIKFIHSATHGGVIISSTKEKYYEKNFTQINRVLQQ